MTTDLPGYAGKILRVDLSSERIWTEPFDPEIARLYLGGAGLGARILYDEVPADVAWDHPDNRVILATGPLAGTPVWGTSALSVVTRGAQTNGATSTQANGFFGANLKSCGYDAIVIQGEARRWVYLYIRDDDVRLLPADHLLGKDTWELQEALSREWGASGHQLSVYGIGPAGESLVRYACIVGDFGHAASKNGCGTVLGKKRFKAVAIARGSRAVRVHDVGRLFEVADEIAQRLKTDPTSKSLYEYGTLPGVVNLGKLGALPIKNYTTNVYPGGDEQLERYAAPAIRALFPHRGHQCSACGMHHCHQSVITDGPHAGEIVDEPEYEGFSGCGAAIGCTDPVGAAWLNTRVDRAGVDVNEFGWVCGLAMEGYEKGWLTKEELGFELPWGDAQAADRLLRLICQRHGIGNLLAEGVKRFCEAKGEPWYSAGVFTQKGAAPRGHDHRARWEEMLDTCVSSTGTLGTGPLFHPVELGVPARRNPFDPEDTAHAVATGLGRRDFDDSIGACIFTTRVSMELVAQAVNATTGADLHLPDALAIGRRIAHLFRAFNLRCGVHGPDLEKPSPRYWSTPVDGPVAGTDIKPHWDRMVARYYELVGWDRASGRPTPETLRQYGLEDVLRDLWGEQVVAR
ncbi:MAG: hypothetical protein HYU88_00190 [Chloroflexi bacterium]|nr:hypothetical protein [Chloroflexota bacterium]